MDMGSSFNTNLNAFQEEPTLREAELELVDSSTPSPALSICARASERESARARERTREIEKAREIKRERERGRSRRELLSTL